MKPPAKNSCLPFWLGSIISALAIIAIVVAAYQSAELEHLRQEVRDSEKGEIISPVQSLLNNDDLCRKNWLKQAQSWISGTDICDK